MARYYFFSLSPSVHSTGVEHPGAAAEQAARTPGGKPGQGGQSAGGPGQGGQSAGGPG